ncbi:hypothetical protein AJ80_02837 [Polytolypa hystricis UAMH7299]|uniref:UEV domain-containing protein n=1 Tax=Polytolypa hystricis (strain UAMH7299) TaxID=1447883 RepID=A0A2B7YG57_POLH7|nr:hypothetical protein AJ80_02837 [Polytolypa hystricis UAMH7299]
MSRVPERTLSWLYRVLTNTEYGASQSYYDPNRTYNDVANLLAQYQSFSPRTEVYTYENGTSALLLQIPGTLPVTFRGVVYGFPITLWMPYSYPREPPTVYVTPTQGMLVRPGQHVSGEGRVYHHYLAHWADAWDRSTLVDLMSILREVFAKEPPVISKQQQQEQQQAMAAPPHQERSAPPAVPPLPPELTRPATQSPPASPRGQQPPPKLPPKPGQISHEQGGAVAEDRYKHPPPLPPLPGLSHDPRRVSQAQPQVYDSQYAPQQPGDGRPYVPPKQPHVAGAGTSNHTYQQEGYRQAQPRPLNSFHQSGMPTGQQYAQSPAYHPQPQASQYPHTSYSQPEPNSRAPSQRPQSFHAPYGPTSYQHPPPPHAPAQPQPQPKKTETPDLLTSPFELELPGPVAAGPPPPIPPNPEKDALLQTLSKTLTQTLHSNLSQLNSGLQPLESQSQALHAAISTLQSEIAALNTLHATLQSNTSILQQSLHHADSIIADAKARLSAPPPPVSTGEPSSTTYSTPNTPREPVGLPSIDDVLVAPTVVGKQMYDLVADERGIQRAIYALQEGLVKDRVGVETWAKLTRGLAREAFLKRALVRKAARGMGLVVEDGV